MEKMTDEKLLTVLSDDISETVRRQRIIAFRLVKKCRERDEQEVANGAKSYRRVDRSTWVLAPIDKPSAEYLRKDPVRFDHCSKNSRRVSVEQWRDGKRIAILPTLKQAAKVTGMSVTSIRKRLHGIVDPDTPTSDGSIWRKHVEGAGV